MVLELALPEESQETFDFLDTLHQTAEKYYPEGVLLVGNSTSDRDLSESFVQDNVLISILTVVFVILVLVFTFQSAGLPVLLILVIQGSVWINFSFPYLMDSDLFFLSYLIVSSIQMGANIDYAIVITNRYTDLKKQMPLHEAVVEALNQAFPTIVTSGTILATAGILIGFLSSAPSISSIGICLGRGTVISIFLVMAVLPDPAAGRYHYRKDGVYPQVPGGHPVPYRQRAGGWTCPGLYLRRGGRGFEGHAPRNHPRSSGRRCPAAGPAASAAALR
ncbi:MAG: MMPL family transporter [Dysosmobacter sp.]